MYIYQYRNWPNFAWSDAEISPVLDKMRLAQGKLMGKMQRMGFDLQEEAVLQTITLDIIKSTEIEGEILNNDEVRSSVARHLGIELGGIAKIDRNVEGVVEMMLDATQNYIAPLTTKRLFNWHSDLFPTEGNNAQNLIVGAWRNQEKGPMQVVSGAMGKERVHYQAPDADVLDLEMYRFLDWFNSDGMMDPVLKAAIAHLWFISIHPFDDGNGRIARAITDMQLAKADQTKQRFYSMSAQIRNERNAYYEILEYTQRGNLDITKWLYWFLNCLLTALMNTDNILSKIITKAAFWQKHGRTALNNRQQGMVNRLLDDFFGKLTAAKWATMMKCSHDTANRDIQDLIEKGILVKSTEGGRSTHYLLDLKTL